MGNPTYLIILSLMLVGTVFLHRSQHLKLYRNLQHCLVYIAVIFICELVWDHYSVSQHIWSFPTGKTIGLRLGVLPIEEYLFFLIVPYFGVTVYKFLEKISAK